MSTQPTPPAVWWSESHGVVEADSKGRFVCRWWQNSKLDTLPADAVRLVLDEVETAWEAATGEIEELRRQVDRLGDTIVKLGADLARVTQERDQAREVAAELGRQMKAWADKSEQQHDQITGALALAHRLYLGEALRIARMHSWGDPALAHAAEVLSDEVDRLRGRRAADLVDLRAAAQDLHDLGRNSPPVQRLPAFELAASRVERVIARIEHRAGDTTDAD